MSELKQVPEDAEDVLRMELLDRQIKAISNRSQRREAQKTLWLSHHWPDQFADRCIKVGSKHICRRCTALYPLAIIVAFAAAFGSPIWPDSWDTTAIWLVALPGTFAYVGEAIGLFSYSAKWQTAMTLITSLAFGKGLSYELQERWSYEFWAPLAVFGAIWLLATWFNSATKPKIS